MTLCTSLFEANSYGFFLFSLALLCQSNFTLKDILVVISMTIISFYLGYELLVFLYPIFLFKKGYRKIAINLPFGLILSKSFIYIFEIKSSFTINGHNLSTILLIFFPTLLLFLLYEKKFLKRFILFYCSVFCFILLIILSKDWLSPKIITSEFFRLLILIFPTFLFFNNGNLYVSKKLVDFKFKFVVICSIIFLTFLFLLSDKKKYEKIIFDESHGAWASVDNNFNENSFGRNYFYSYSMLKELIKKKYPKTVIHKNENIKFKNINSLLIIKMPTRKLSDKYIEKVSKWVEQGGDILVIADHTNLYNSTFYLNKLLEKFKIKISETAVFNKNGKLNKNNNSMTSFLFPTVETNIKQMEWLTGTSLKDFPINFIPLGFYGLSYSEDADYSNQNRFAKFNPTLNFPFINHISFGKINYKKGSIFVLLDSTPWSNFAFSKKMYKQYINNILIVCETKILDIKHYLIVFFIVYFIFQLVSRSKIVYPLSLSLLIVYFIFTFISGKIILPNISNKTDYDTLVYSGKKANYKSMNQLIPTGENNYLRIVGSLNRNGLNPLILDAKGTRISLNNSQRIIAIEPEFNQLPKPYELINFIKEGGSFTLLFSRNQTSDPLIIEWISKLGIFLKRKNSLGFVESIINKKDDLLSRNQTFATKDVSWLAFASINSLFKLQYINNIIQSFLIRPISLPYKAGYLNISFSSDQFSDSVVGDIWEGVIPSNISVQQERMLASLLNGNYKIKLTQDFISNIKNNSSEFSKYALFEDGRIILSGNLYKKITDNFNPSKNIETYLFSLLNQSLTFIKNNCWDNVQDDKCNSNFVSQDMIEWRVEYKKIKQNITTVELIHKRNPDGLNFSYNIIFSK